MVLVTSDLSDDLKWNMTFQCIRGFFWNGIQNLPSTSCQGSMQLSSFDIMLVVRDMLGYVWGLRTAPSGVFESLF